MTKLTRSAALFSFLASTFLCAIARGQALPAAVGAAPYRGFQLPKLRGSLQYAVSVSETATRGYYQVNNGSSTAEFTSLSGDVAYLSRSTVHPFSMVYSGGFLGNTSGQPSSYFQNLALSQVLITRNWNFVASDSISYLPNTATVGLSGVAGLGDLGVTPVQLGPNAGQGVLTNNASRVTNVVNGSAERRLTGKTSIQGAGSFLVQRFLDSGSSSGLDSNQETASLGPSHRIDARNTISANYTYSRFTYAINQFGFTTQGANLQYARVFNRRFSGQISIGPQRTSSANTATTRSTLNVATNLAGIYTGERSGASFGYTRGVNNGSGVIQGAQSDSLYLAGSRMLGRTWSAGLSTSYTRSAGLPIFNLPSFSTQTLVAGVQASKAISRSFQAYASYTAQKQSVQGSGALLDVFSGLSQVIGVGLTYSPAQIHFGRL